MKTFGNPMKTYGKPMEIRRKTTGNPLRHSHCAVVVVVVAAKTLYTIATVLLLSG